MVEIILDILARQKLQREQSAASVESHTVTIDSVSCHGATALMAAIVGVGPPIGGAHHLPQHQVLTIATMLLNAGAGLEPRNRRNLNVLDEVCVRGLVDVARLFIDRGASVQRPMRGVGPLYWAVVNNHTSTAALLLSHGADVGGGAAATTAFSASLLHLACMKGNVPMVTLLLDHGANPDQRDPTRGDTPLHYAAKNGHLDVMRLLERRGADVGIPNRDGISAAALLGLAAFVGTGVGDKKLITRPP